MLNCQDPYPSAPPEGILATWPQVALSSILTSMLYSQVTHRKHGCGVVQHIHKTSNGTTRGFSVIFGDETRSQLLAQVLCCSALRYGLCHVFARARMPESLCCCVCQGCLLTDAAFA